MKIVILGLSITSSWGNGHATTYRGLVRELSRRGHDVLFLERDQPWYAEHRDLPEPDFCRAKLYRNVRELRNRFTGELEGADCIIVGSYVPEGKSVGDWVTQIRGPVTAFYDIDTPITVRAMRENRCEYLSREVAEAYDLYLSFSGGSLLDELNSEFGVRHPVAFYCAVDPALYFPESAEMRWDLAYLGTFSEDRQPGLESLLIRTARDLPERRFVVAGSLYPDGIPWPGNVERIEHLSPGGHRRFYNSQRWALNLTRSEMVRAGWSPSVRLFEAAACGTPIISDRWSGLHALFQPGEEILTAGSTAEVRAILEETSEEERRQIGQRARVRVLSHHTAAHRAVALERLIHSCRATKVADPATVEEAAVL